MILRFKEAKMGTHIEAVIGALKELREQVLAELPCICNDTYKGGYPRPMCFRHDVEQVIDECIKQHEDQKDA